LKRYNSPVKQYYPTIGLEIHAELSTNSKMFCSCPNDTDQDTPNTNICPVCTAQPGALPVPNAEAIRRMVTIGLAVDGQIANYTEFDRKSYFYPDIPKGYQISQYKHPVVSGGTLMGVQLTRIHLEEDTGTSQHAAAGTLVDYNRAGVPLMELVTEPVIHDSETAMKFGKELQLLLRTLGVAHANMEKGELRVEVNVSVSDKPDVFGTKVEVKNINSFSVAGKAIDYEIARMTALYEEGREGEIVQETRGWDDAKQITFSQRKKESAHDYRYFPDPDLPKLMLHEMFDLEAIRSELPELPWQKRERYQKEFGIKAEDVESYVTDRELGAYFETIVAGKDSAFAQMASNYITSDLLGLLKNDPEAKMPDAKAFTELITLASAGTLGSRGTKDILAVMVRESIDPEAYAKEHNLIQQNDTESLKAVAQAIIDASPDKAAEYRAGKEALLMFFVGQVMKETKGAANPAVTQEIIKELLK
jgi:aspartyl-tRNA(Asn)/glutamyl-tRNA(Gln) amidotransferase subunit B